MNQQAFNNKKYLKEQEKEILKRIDRFGDKLYLEFGGKIINDYHGSRVLPGYDPNIKVYLLEKLREKVEIIFCISSNQIEKRKMRADFGITYDLELLRLIDELKKRKLKIAGVAITCFQEQPAVVVFKKKLERKGIKTYIHKYIHGYPENIDLIVSQDGYGANEYISTKKPLIAIVAPGPGSGKLAVALSQLYHEQKRKINAGYAKFETFPVWDLPLKHPLNIAYEAATADIGDYNLIDPFYLEAHKKIAINYNRDIELFPVLREILKRITKKDNIYSSPTDMGVNRCSTGIKDDKIINEACKQEVIRRYFHYNNDYFSGLAEEETLRRINFLMKELNIIPEHRKVVLIARRAAKEAQEKGKGNEGVFCGAAIELPNEKLISGKNSSLMNSISAMIINAIKELSDIPDHIHLLSPNIIDSITIFKKNIMGEKTASLNLEETLIALSISGASNPATFLAIKKLTKLKGCQVHTTHLLSAQDKSALRKLKINFTNDINFPISNSL